MTNRQPDALTRIANLSPEKRALLESRLNGRHASAQSGAIPRRPTHDTTPLSSAQERLWFLDQYEPANPIYNRPLALRLAGSLDIVALEQSLSEIVRRHDMLRTTFPRIAGQPRQVVAPPSSVVLTVINLPPCAEGQRETTIRRYVSEDGECPFDLSRGPLWRALLLRLDDDEHILLITLHHIISDGWSDSVLSRELGTLYNAFATGQSATLLDLPIQYADYACWQRERLTSGAFDEHLVYWRDHLAGAPTVLDLPTDHQRPPTQMFRGATYSTLLPTALLEALKRLSQDENATLYMTLLAAFQTLLHRYTGQDDLLVGSPIAGRMRVETEGLIDIFVNTLVLRGDLSDDPSFRALLTRTRATTLAAYDHQEVPFEQLIAELHIARDLSRTPLVQVMFVLQNAPRADLQLPGLTAHPLRVDTGTAKFDLSLFMIETLEGAHAAFEYNTDLFDADTITRLSGHFRTLLESVVADLDRPLSALPLLTGAERRQLLVDWNETRAEYPCDACVHELFAVQAARTPDAVAVVYENHQLTYRELDERANQLAHYLRRRGVGPDVLVGICVERSVEMVVGLLGILKAGGAYMPLDPAYPKDRLAFMLEDARVPVLLTQQRLRDRLPTHEARVVYLDADWSVIAAETAKPPTSAATGDSVAYVIYTSGSTGAPKGALIPHNNVGRLFAATQAWFHVDARDVWTLFHSFAFDFSVWELWGALLHGSRLVIVPYITSRSPEAFYDLVRQERVTVLNQTPSAFAQFIHVEESMSAPAALSLRLVILGGEALSPSALTPWFERNGDRSPQVVNMYGITETTVHVTYHPLTVADLSSTTGSVIGIPIPDLQVYLLDAHLQPVPIGVSGEIYVGGAGLACGYLNRPDLTAERFIPHPFDDTPNARLYKTGDLARYRPDGAIEYLGRLDHQVKIRGYRIELGEVKAALTRHAAVREVVVVARADAPGDTRLVAYIVANGAPSTAQWRGFLKETLPGYMVPAAFVLLDTLPLTPNGKTDRRALASYDFAPASTRQPSTDRVDLLRDNPLYHQLTRLWEDVLHTSDIGVADSFFTLGGHSLLAVRLVNEIARATGVRLPLATFFTDPTVEGVARALKHRRDGDAPDRLLPVRTGGSKRPLFFLHGDYNGGGFYCVNLAHYLDPERPFYALHPHGLDGRAVPPTIEAMAAEHVATMRGVQPEGPYLLGGYCNGGLIAFEMARQLRERGERVEELIVLHATAVNAHLAWLHGAIHAIGALTHRSHDERQRLFLLPRRYILRTRHFVSMDAQERKRAMLWQARQAAHRTAGRHGRGRPFGVDASTASARDASAWTMVSREVMVRTVPGTHVSCVTTYADILAAHLNACLDAGDDQSADELL